MEYRIITTMEELVSLQPCWVRIQEQEDNLTYFSTFEYCHHWWQVYQDCKNYDLFIIVIYHNHSVAGIAPLVLNRKRNRLVKYTALEFMARGDYHDFIINSLSQADPMNIIKKIFSVIENCMENIDELNLTHISQHSLLARYLLRSSYNKYFTYLVENPIIRFDAYRDFEDYCKKHYSKNTRKKVNRLREQTNYRFVAKNLKCVKTISHIHVAEKVYHHRKGNNYRHSLFEDEKRLAVLNNLYANSDHTLTFMLISSDSKPMGYITGYLYRDTFYCWNSAYHPDFVDLSIGTVLFFELIRYFFTNQNIRVLDDGCGRYPWKFMWTDSFNFLYQFHYVKPEKMLLKTLIMLRGIRTAVAEMH